VKTIIEQEGNFELTSWMVVGQLNLTMANTKAAIGQVSVRNFVWNPSMALIQDLPQYINAAREHVIFATARCTMSTMKTIIQMIHLLLKCMHVEGLSFFALDRSWKFPHTTNSESGWSSPHSWQRDSPTSHNGQPLASNVAWPLSEHLKELSWHSTLLCRWGLSHR